MQPVLLLLLPLLLLFLLLQMMIVSGRLLLSKVLFKDRAWRHVLGLANGGE